MNVLPPEWIKQASERIVPYIRRTPVTFDPDMGIFLKWKNQQLSGSYKVRGAFNKVLVLQDWERTRGMVAASAGNHGLALGMAGRFVGAKVSVFVSNRAVLSKIDSMRKIGVEIITVDGDYGAVEQQARRYALENKKTWVSPYNDCDVIAGQGTIGSELFSELHTDKMLSLVIPVGGGGLLAGIGASVTSFKPRPQIIGVCAGASPFMHALFYKGTQEGIHDLPTLADGLSGAVEAGSITIPMARKLADDIILVSEQEIAHAISFAWQKYHQCVEGAGATGLAAILTGKVSPPAVVLISGGNIQAEVHKKICRDW